MNTRKRRLLNKRIKPRIYTFSYWAKWPNAGWKRFEKTYIQRLPPYVFAIEAAVWGEKT
jgi:hypothetical protein